MPVQFSITLFSLAGLLIMLGAGLICFGIYNRVVYPMARKAHEKAKLTGSHGRDPNVYLLMVKVLTLVLLPILGLAFGDLILGAIYR